MSSPPIELVARETFGFESLLPGQREAIASVLGGRDTLVVMPPGSGKSAIYEIAGVMNSGVTIVVSPRALAPEQLANADVLDQARAAAPTLIAIDDAHCVAESGHDFRPDYLRLGAFIAEMGHPTVLALTDSAPPPVREEIVSKLHMHDPAMIVRD